MAALLPHGYFFPVFASYYSYDWVLNTLLGSLVAAKGSQHIAPLKAVFNLRRLWVTCVLSWSPVVIQLAAIVPRGAIQAKKPWTYSKTGSLPQLLLCPRGTLLHWHYIGWKVSLHQLLPLS